MKLYTFGDSWTRNGDFYIKTHYNSYINENERPWPEQLAEYLKLELVNESRGAASPQSILNKLILNLNKVESNSTVVISMSPMTRITLPSYREDGRLNNQDLWAFEPEGSLEKKKKYNSFPWHEITEEMYLETKRFAANVVNSIYSNYSRFYFNQFNSLLLLLQSTKNIKFLFWNWEYANFTKSSEFYIDRIVDHTNGKIDDYHPSVKGHNQLFSYFKDALDSNTKYLWF